MRSGIHQQHRAEHERDAHGDDALDRGQHGHSAVVADLLHAAVVQQIGDDGSRSKQRRSPRCSDARRSQ